MEPIWRLEENVTTGLQFWSRLDRNSDKRSVRFRKDVEIREYLIVNDPTEPGEESSKYWTSSLSGLEAYRIAGCNENDKGHALLAASIAVVLLTMLYKWWVFHQ